MALLYPTHDAGPTDWSSPSWSLADDNAKNHVKPTDTDIERKLWRDEHDAKTELGVALLANAKALKEKKNAKEV